MQVHTSKGRFELPERMRTQLEAFRRRLWWIKVVTSTQLDPLLAIGVA